MNKKNDRDRDPKRDDDKREECARCHKQRVALFVTKDGSVCAGCAEYIVAMWCRSNPGGL